MKLNDLADHYNLKEYRGYEDWSVDLKFRMSDILHPWDVVITDPEGKEYDAFGGTPEEAYQKARFKAKI